MILVLLRIFWFGYFLFLFVNEFLQSFNQARVENYKIEIFKLGLSKFPESKIRGKVPGKVPGKVGKVGKVPGKFKKDL